MARTTFFGSRSGTKAADQPVVEDDARTEDLATAKTEERDRTLEERVSEDRTVPRRALFTNRDRTALADQTAVDDKAVVDGRDRVVTRPTEPTDQTEPVVPVVSKPVSPAPERVVAPRPARVSFAATLGLMVGVAAAAATFTGRLAWVGVAAGVIAILLSFVGVVAGARPHVAGRGLGTLGVLFGVVAIAFGVLALTHTVSWLDSNVDTVGQIRHWFDTRVPFTKSW